MRKLERTLSLWVLPWLAAGACRALKLSSQPSESVNQPPQWMEGLEASGLSGDVKLWDLNSPRADIIDNQQTIAVFNPYVNFYKQGRLDSVLTARRGWLDAARQDIRAEEDVVVTSTDGARLEASWLLFDSRTQLIRSTSPVRIIRSDSITHGDNLVATVDLSSVRLMNETVELPPHQNSPR